MPGPTEEQKWINNWKNGDEAAFNALFRRYFDDLLQFATRQLKDKDLAEEIVMDLMLKLWQMPDPTQILQLEQYLYRSVKNAIISHWRKKALLFISLDNVDEFREPLTHSADYRIIDIETQAVYKEKLAALSPQRRMVFTMSREQNMTHAEIAQQTNLSVNTVKNHLKASLDYFRENLQPYTETTLILIFFNSFFDSF